jgi:hypothetical protein
MSEQRQTDEASGQAPGLLQAIASAMAAAFGVQSGRNRQRDFKQGKARNFIIAGLLFTALFIAVMIVIVKLVLRHAGM